MGTKKKTPTLGENKTYIQQNSKQMKSNFLYFFFRTSWKQVVLRNTNILKSLMMFSGIAVREHDKEDRLFFSSSDITFYTIYTFANWESLAGRTTVYSSTPPYFYFEIKLQWFRI